MFTHLIIYLMIFLKLFHVVTFHSPDWGLPISDSSVSAQIQDYQRPTIPQKVAFTALNTQVSASVRLLLRAIFWTKYCDLVQIKSSK